MPLSAPGHGSIGTKLNTSISPSVSSSSEAMVIDGRSLMPVSTEFLKEGGMDTARQSK